MKKSRIISVLLIVLLMVSLSPTAFAIGDQLDDATYAVGEEADALTYKMLSGTALSSWQWQRKEFGNAGSWQSYSGETGSSFTPPTTTAGEYHYRCRYQKSLLDEVVYSDTVIITVLERPTVIIEPNGQSLAMGEAAQQFVASSPDVNGNWSSSNIRWFSGLTSDYAAAATDLNNIQAQYTPDTSEPGTRYYFCVADFTDTLDGTSTITVVSEGAMVYVESPNFELSSTYPADSEINAGDDRTGFSISVDSGDFSGMTLEWFVSYDGSDYAINSGTIAEIGGVQFELGHQNLLYATAPEEAASVQMQVYCVASNATGWRTSRIATLTVNGAEPNPEPYVFPFTDVADSAWYRNDVEIAHKNGLINGKTETTYEPDSNMTIAEAIKLAACMHQLYHDGVVSLTNGSPQWYSSYVQYALDNNIILTEYENYNELITRDEYVYIFYRSLPSTEFGEINSVADNAVPDVMLNDEHGDEIYAFYRAGILIGSDAQGTFRPESNILRSEVAAILTRMFDVTARQSITLTN